MDGEERQEACFSLILQILLPLLAGRLEEMLLRSRVQPLIQGCCLPCTHEDNTARSVTHAHPCESKARQPPQLPAEEHPNTLSSEGWDQVMSVSPPRSVTLIPVPTHVLTCAYSHIHTHTHLCQVFKFQGSGNPGTLWHSQ